MINIPMINIPKNTLNTKESLESVSEQVIEYVVGQITKNHSNDENNVVADVCDGSDFSQDRIFPNDCILHAMKKIAEAGYFVWHHKDYAGHNKYWITRTTNRPHNWYSRIY